jgi:hypothetical protein
MATPYLNVCSLAWLQQLYEAARDLVDQNQATPKMLVVVQELETLTKNRDDKWHRIVAAAQELAGKPEYLDGDDLVIDDHTIVYHNGLDGYWVMGWLWISDYEEDHG